MKSHAREQFPQSPYRVLGPLKVPGVVRGPKVRRLMALLLVNAGEVVSMDAMVDELWGNNPPSQATSTARTHVYHLRKMLAGGSALSTVEGADALVTWPCGYQLCVPDQQIDSRIFGQLVDRGRTQSHAGAFAEARESLQSALALWRGRALADLVLGEILSRHVAHLHDLKTRAQELRIEADMRLGLHRDLIPELRSLIALDPLNEWLHARLIEALHASGRRSEALRAYHELRVLLDRELGLGPSDELRRLQREILTADAQPPALRPVAR
ncbi:AfsR/SARP family transcriptional regulator [Nocardia pseudovaccinii]|uniref:AfsR/SARP family transcriptional regulator n=1 Tax=Nocardia pseudovaccinii TaxID=189540 RepID=UPI003D8DFA3D